MENLLSDLRLAVGMLVKTPVGTIAAVRPAGHRGYVGNAEEWVSSRTGGFKAMRLPWISIPSFAEPGQAHAFASRETQVVSLYTALVRAGNAVRQGRVGVRHQHVVHGYFGVGKSALLLQVLGMLRGELLAGAVPGQRLELPPGLPEPDDPQRWLILRLSGKQVGDIGALSDAIRSAVLDEEEAHAGRAPLSSFLDEVIDQTERQIPGALELPIVHRVLRKRETALYKAIRSELTMLAATLEITRSWYGATVHAKEVHESQSESRQDLDAHLKAVLKGHGLDVGTVAARAGLEVAAGIVRRYGESRTRSSQIERRWTVSSEIVVDALNRFFTATDRAGLPTILVLDDFDELTSTVGPSHFERSRVLAAMLGAFSRLKPTCLVLALREEYMHEDIRRQYARTPVPPLTRIGAELAIEAWGELQQPALETAAVDHLKALGRRLLEGLPADEAVAIPFHFLQLVIRLARTEAPIDEFLDRYLREQFYFGGDALKRIANNLSHEDAVACAAGRPIEGEKYSLSSSERATLGQAGLVRPAMAGDPGDPRITVDPVAAYFRMAKRTEEEQK